MCVGLLGPYFNDLPETGLQHFKQPRIPGSNTVISNAYSVRSDRPLQVQTASNAPSDWLRNTCSIECLQYTLNRKEKIHVS